MPGIRSSHERMHNGCRRRRIPRGFTLLEMLVTLGIIGVVAALGFTLASMAMQQGRKASEISAAKSLISAYLTYPVDNSGQLMVAHYEGASSDLDGQEYELPDGARLGSAELHRYPFRLAPYMEYKLDGTILVNRNKDQIQRAFSPDQFHYGTSLCPAMGINYYFVGGYKVDNEISGAGECATTMVQVAKPESLLVFASAFTEVNGQKIDGRYGVEPPSYRARLWDANLHVDARYGGGAVCAFLDGSVRLHTIDELRDMRLWSKNAAELDDKDYTVRASSSGGIGGGGGGRGGRR